MRFSVIAAAAGLLLSSSAPAQTACIPGGTQASARTALGLRHGLRGAAVGELDPVVPPAVQSQLTRFKQALVATAEAVMACASTSATPEALQETLAAALHANLSADSETVLVTRTGKDLGAYGSDLAVQVLPLSSAPRHLEIDFRFGIECGDDNVLLIFDELNGHWHPMLHWMAPPYANISGALGDFVLLTPITGLPPNQNWRVVVAHGSPSCKSGEGRSRFALDLLQPTTDPARPTVAWHLDRPYGRGDTPRMATTEETLTFELLPPPAEGKPEVAVPPAPRPAAQLYRFRISAENQVQPVESAPDTASPTAPATEPVMPGSPASATQPSTPVPPPGSPR